jgi:hypothetical protein
MSFIKWILIGAGALASAAAGASVDSLTRRARAWCEARLDPVQARLDRYAAARTEIETKLMSRLGFIPRIEAELTRDPDFKTIAKVTAYDRTGAAIAFTSSESTGGYSLFVGHTEVRPGLFRNKGVSELMFAHLLLMQPTARRVASRLLYDNEKVVRDLIAAGWSCADAIRQTPAAKMRARFGFTTFGEPPFCRGDFSLMLILDHTT